MSDSDCGSELVSHGAIKVDCTSGLVVEVFNDLDQVRINIVKAYSRPLVFKDVIEVLMLQILLTQYRKIEHLFCRTASWSEAYLFLCDD